MEMDTTEGKIQKALAETTRVPVEALKVKSMYCPIEGEGKEAKKRK